MKKCNKCGKTKPLSEYHKLKISPDGYRYKCNSCRTDESRVRKYGLDEDGLERVNNTHNCEICDVHVEGKFKHVDHDHKTGLVRGVLCIDCNRGVELIDRGLVDKAIAYIRKPLIREIL